MTGPVRVVATLRPEFIDHVLADSGLAVLPTRVYPLRPLHREALRLVIEGPARLAGIEVEAHLVARLVEDTDSGEALPLLAFTLAQLAEGVSRGGQLSVARYEQLGRVQGATGETHASLVNTLAAGPYLGTLTGHTSSVNSVVFAPDGHTLATGSDDSTVIL